MFPFWEHNTWENEDVLQPQRLITIRPDSQSFLKVARKRWSLTGPYLLGQKAQFQCWNKKDEHCSQAWLQTEHMHNHFYCCSVIKCTTYCALALILLLIQATHTSLKIKQCTVSSASTSKCTAAHHRDDNPPGVSRDTFPLEINKFDNIKITVWQSFNWILIAVKFSSRVETRRRALWRRLAKLIISKQCRWSYFKTAFCLGTSISQFKEDQLQLSNLGNYPAKLLTKINYSKK